MPSWRSMDAITIRAGRRTDWRGWSRWRSRWRGAVVVRADLGDRTLDAAPHAVVDVVPHPLPEAILSRQVGIRLHLGAPALHDVVFDRPEAHPIALHQLAPVVADLRAR